MRNKYDVIGLAIVCIWCIPMLLTRGRIEYGDFGYFAQVYEAIKLNILSYHQFPWWNPWIAGGIPLYANPQAGVFSITTFFSLFVATPVALKATVFIFYILGYLSCALLLRYLKVRGILVMLLSLIWVLNGFFVAHLPMHFTFVWFLIAPWFIYLALRAGTRKYAGTALGVSWGLMALSQVHYSFVQISLVVCVIIGVRLVVDKVNRRRILLATACAVGIFVLLAGHRILYTLQDVHSFPREVFDPTSTLVEDAYSFFVPFSFNYGIRPVVTPFYGWLEQTVYPSIFFMFSAISSVILLVHIMREARGPLHEFVRRRLTASSAIFCGVLVSLAVGIGGRRWFFPYSWLKLLPFISQTRIASRWFIFTLLGLLLLVGVMYMHKQAAQGIYRTLIVSFCALAVVELFILNFGYQAKVLIHAPVRPPKGTSTSSLTFGQDIRFGESPTSPDGLPIPDSDKQYLYREYESTMFNIGTILANEVFVNLYNNTTSRCSYVAGCGLVLSGNAKVISWSPGKIVLSRTNTGRVELNINNSSYISINGHRQDNVKTVADLYHGFFLPTSTDRVRTITLTFAPGVPL